MDLEKIGRITDEVGHQLSLDPEENWRKFQKQVYPDLKEDTNQYAIMRQVWYYAHLDCVKNLAILRLRTIKAQAEEEKLFDAIIDKIDNWVANDLQILAAKQNKERH